MEQYLGEIKLIPYSTKIPKGWHECDGTILPMQGNQALYSLLGCNYGGDGKTTFALPDLRGRVPVGSNTEVPAKDPRYGLGLSGGVEEVTLTPNQMPRHKHTINVSSNTGTATSIKGAIYAAVPTSAKANLYAPFGKTPFAADEETFEQVGGGKAHNNMQPSLALRWIISMRGIYPPRY
jgi:microcystin-dependent protein